MHYVRVLRQYLTCDRWKAIQPKWPVILTMVESVNKSVVQLHSICNELFTLILGKENGFAYVKKILSNGISLFSSGMELPNA